MPGTTVERATANAVIRIHFDFICDVLLDRREMPVTYTLWMRSQGGSYTEAELMLIGVNSTLAEPLQKGSLTFSLKGRELQPQGGIFDGDSWVTAQQESEESKYRQEKGWHVPRLFVPNPFQVNLLRA